MLLFIRLGFAIFGFLIRFFPSLQRAPDLIQTAGGTNYGFRHSTSKNGHVTGTQIWMPISRGIHFRLQSENGWTQFCKTIGFGRETQIGSEFDEQFYIASDHGPFLSKLKLDPQFQTILRELQRAGVTKFVSDGNGYLVLKMDGPRETLSDEFAKSLDTLAGKLKEFATRRLQIDPFLAKVMFLEAVLWSAFGYGLSGYLTFTVEPEIVHISTMPIFLIGISVGAGFLLTWIAAIFFLMRQSSRAPLLISDFLFMGSIVLIAAGPMAAADINRALDTSEAEFTRAGIYRTFSRTTGTGKNRRTRHYLELVYVNNPYQLPGTFEVGWDRNKFAANQGIEFEVRKGYFNVPYIAQKNSIPFPASLAAPVQSRPEDRTSIVELAMQESKSWYSMNRAASLPPEAQKAEQYYQKNALKSREHLVNGVKQGPSVYFHPNGQLYTKIDWKDGGRHGSFKVYRADGTLEQWTSYKEGKPHGMFAWFNKTGDIERPEYLAIYKDGEVVDGNRDALLPIYQKLVRPTFDFFQ